MKLGELYDEKKDFDGVIRTYTKIIKLNPENLMIRNDQLYMYNGDNLIKFAERGLLKISEMLERNLRHFF